jgi:hypothetical protein
VPRRKNILSGGRQVIFWRPLDNLLWLGVMVGLGFELGFRLGLGLRWVRDRVRLVLMVTFYG